MRLVFLLTERWSILRLNERIKRELFTKNIYDVRVLPGDVEEIMASVKTFPLVRISTQALKMCLLISIAMTDSRYRCQLVLDGSAQPGMRQR